LRDAKIFVTNDLNEHRLAELVRAGAPIDSFGVGTQLATSADAPALSAVYKLVELKRGDTVHYTAKFSGEKSTLPGAKQIYRYPDRDVVALYTECNADFKGEPLIRPMVMNGELVEPSPSSANIRKYAQSAIAALPKTLHSLEASHPHPVDISPRLIQMAESLRHDLQPVKP